MLALQTVKSLALAATLSLSLASGASSSAAQNQIFNAGFELGPVGLQCVKYLDLKNDPNAKYEGPEADATTFVSGKRSLRIPTRPGEKCILIFPETKLKPGARYSLSLSLKSDVAGLKTTAMVCSAMSSGNWGWDAYEKSWTATSAWKKASFEFTPRKPWPNEAYNVFLCFGEENRDGAKAGSLWIDEIQLVEGDGKSWAPANEIEICAIPPNCVLTANEAGATANIEIRAVNYGGNQLARTNAVFEQIDERDGEAVFTSKIPLDLEASELVSKPIEMPLRRFGSFLLKCSLKPTGKAEAGSFPGYCLAVGRYERKPLDLSKSFCMGLNWWKCGFKIPPNWGGGPDKLAFEAAGAGPEEAYERLSSLGCRLARDVFEWREQEPREGSFDFAQQDKTTNLLLKSGIQTLPILCSEFMENDEGASGWPKWLKPRCKKLTESGDWGATVKLPPLDAARSYCDAVALHFKGRITHYEIVNEPNGCLSPELYAQYLKAANEGIRKADPNAKIIGFCTTGDKGGALTSFLAKCAANGSLKDADAISFHPYDSVSLGFETPADKPINEMKAILRRQLGSPSALQIWDTELYYVRMGHLAGDDIFELERHTPAQFACRVLTDLGEGVAQSPYLEQCQTLRNRYMPHFFGRLVTAGEPGPDLAACSALARRFEGAKPKAKFLWGEESVCYVFEREGRLSAAFWAYGDVKSLTLAIKASDSDATLFDLFGNQVPLDKRPFALGDSPFYLEPKGMAADAFLSALKTAKVEAAKPFATSSVKLLQGDDGAFAVALSVSNQSKERLEASVGFQGGAASSSEIAELALSPGEEKACMLELSLAPSFAVDKLKDSTVKIYARGKLWNIPVKLPTPEKAQALRKRDCLADGASAKFELQAESPWRQEGEKGASADFRGKENGRLELKAQAPAEGFYRLSWLMGLQGQEDGKGSLALDFSSPAGANRVFFVPPTKEGLYFWHVYLSKQGRLSAAFSLAQGKPRAIEMKEISLRRLFPKDLARNQILDGDFESDGSLPSAWTNADGSASGLSLEANPDFLAGRRCLRIDTKQASSVVSLRVPAIPGKEYEFKLWAKSTGQDMPFVAGMQSWSVYGHKGEHFNDAHGFRASSEWKKCEFKLRIPSDISRFPDLANDPTAFVFINGEPGGSGKLLIDNVSFAPSQN